MDGTRGSSRCTRKAALTVFFGLELVAFTFTLLALLSPSWQWVSLENGRTEHHHGLWLDCKRDYSPDYGRPREYYETLFQREHQNSPFYQFYLPPLQCVYKFDYYIDPEDLYDHNHDENRLQNDPYQHLFLGWKIAALAACGVSVTLAAIALLLGICSYCHRTFICASTVLVTAAAFFAVVGIIIFYMWANYQDNKVIKEEDNIYEQQYGWAFHAQLIGTILHWLAGMLGCFATSVSFRKGRAKLVKIEVVEGGDDAHLLSSSSSSTAPFKRSFSAIYRVDSSALRDWEADYMKKMRESQRRASSNFQRTASMPNIVKKNGGRKSRRVVKQGHARSQNDLHASSQSNVFSETSQSTTFTNVSERKLTPPHSTGTPKLPLKSALKTPQQQRKQPETSACDVTYEYLVCGDRPLFSSKSSLATASSIKLESFAGGSRQSTMRPPPVPARPERLTRLGDSPQYDAVYEQIPADTYLQPDTRQRISTSTFGDDDPRGGKTLLSSQAPHGSAQSVTFGGKSTLIDDVAFDRPATAQSSPLLEGPFKTRERWREQTETRVLEELRKRERLRNGGTNVDEAIQSSSIFSDHPVAPSQESKPPLTVRDFAFDRAQTGGYGIRLSGDYGSHDAAVKASTSVDDGFPPPPPEIGINTFGVNGRGSQRSITNLMFRPGAENVDVFSRPDSLSSYPSSTVSSVNNKKKPPPPTPLRRLIAIPDEVDRSVGSSTLLENDSAPSRIDSPSLYARDAELRLNLFLADNGQRKEPDNETTV